MDEGFTQEMLDRLVTAIKKDKEVKFLDDPEDCDIMPSLTAYGHEGEALTMWLAGVDRDDLPEAMLAVGLAASDFMLHVGESYMLVQNRDEDGNAPDIPVGTLQQRFEAGDKEVLEAVLIQGADRKGTYVFGSLPFRRLPGRLEWVEDRGVVSLYEPDAEFRPMGFMQQAMEHAMAGPSMEARMTEQGIGFDAFGLTRREAELHCACVAAKHCATKGWQVGFSLRSQEEVDLIKGSMEHSEIPGHLMEFRA